MNTNTGQVYPTMGEAFAALGPSETPADIVEVFGTPEAVAKLSRAVQQMRAIEKRRAALDERMASVAEVVRVIREERDQREEDASDE